MKIFVAGIFKQSAFDRTIACQILRVSAHALRASRWGYLEEPPFVDRCFEAPGHVLLSDPPHPIYYLRYSIETLPALRPFLTVNTGCCFGHWGNPVIIRTKVLRACLRRGNEVWKWTARNVGWIASEKIYTKDSIGESEMWS